MIETDYLVVGAGATGMTFTDSLLTHTDAEVVLVDRQDRPGGHWLHAYPFVRLHTPSAFYGVNSRALGRDALDVEGRNAGRYERATGGEVLEYFQRVLAEDLLPTGRVRFIGMHDHAIEGTGRHVLTNRVTGERTEVLVRRKLVDATYLPSESPATHTRSYSVEPGVVIVPVGGLTTVVEPADRYVVLGAGKTSMDACMWLLDQGVRAADITWVRPRDAWLLPRGRFQPLALVALTLDGLSLELEAASGATGLEDLLDRLAACGQLDRLDPDVRPTMYHCALADEGEIEALRTIEHVVRLGHVVSIAPRRINLTDGSVDVPTRSLFIDCTARGLSSQPVRPVFEPARITPQTVRACSPVFNAAFVAFLESTRRSDEDKNRLTPVVPGPQVPADWIRNTLNTYDTLALWSAEPDIDAWVSSSRLNAVRGVLEHAGEPLMQRALARYSRHLPSALDRLRELLVTPVSS